MSMVFSQSPMVSSPGGLPSRICRPARRGALRRAATLMETSVVLMIFAAIITLGLGLAYLVLRQNTVVAESQNLVSLAGSVVRTKSNTGYSTDPTQIMAALDAMSLIPSNVSRTGSGTATALTNGWGGAITIQAVNGGSDFSIEYDQIPQSDCVQIVRAINPNILQSVGSGSAATTDISQVGTSDAIAMCSASTNSITWSTQYL